ncbi:elongation of very long chain fatty acids protein 4-like [Tropilaelaps mercedesae]|uniref:Elongation of very long chain fatty acids protein n=1 Tax=Tropilaelaps mercedesae TaxID=418985 RepID=A0A1V9XHX4_9ACAR|nr:elongation of very long chain fatty acids protein 4-like [Tropilaelaps mercedesae]
MLAALLGSFILTVKSGLEYTLKPSLQVFLPRFMRDRKPFRLTNVIRLYNLALVATNAYFFSRLAPLTYLGEGGYNLLCQGVDVLLRDERTLRILSLTYYYSIIRIVEFMDTVFFVLRKKFSQASALNVSHHCISVALPWWGLAYGSDGQVMLLVLVNMAIHVVMYFYYFLSSFGPSIQRYLFWKKYLTRVQIAQFIVTAIHMSIPLVVDCGYPKSTSVITLLSMVYFIVMFGHFYRRTYNKNIHMNIITSNPDIINQIKEDTAVSKEFLPVRRRQTP